MKVLFDTHAFLWIISDDARLSRVVREIFTAPENEILLSAASVWEVLVKADAGKLPIKKPVARYLLSQLRKTSTSVLPILLSHVVRLEGLPLLHRDPFDRIIVAQALTEKIPIVSADSKLRLYPVEVLW